MTKVNFYQLSVTSLEQALPRLIEKIFNRGLHVVLMAQSSERLAWVNELLWVYRPDSFLPHGLELDKDSFAQPIFLTQEEQNPNKASILILIDGAQPMFMGTFDNCLDLFDGTQQEVINAARKRWESAKLAGYEVCFWQQDKDGQWRRSA